MRIWNVMVGWLVLSIVLIGCATPPAAPNVARTDSSQPSAPAPRTRVVTAVAGDVRYVSETARQEGPGGAGTELEAFLNAGLAVPDDQNVLRAQLAEAVPTLENGGWKLFPDGRMETTWRLKPGIRWHDGVPFTSDDLLFTATVDQDKGVPRASRSAAYEAIDRIEAPDAATLTITWKRPFIDADRMFTSSFSFALPMPRHLLEQSYQEDTANLMQHPYWLAEFVGTGPYRIRNFQPSNFMVLEASSDYVLGRPRIDEIEVRFIQDTNALMANLLAGTVELTLGAPGISIDQAVQVRDQWREGHVELGPGGWVTIYPQLMNPGTPIISNLQFRRALLHGTDRQQMVDTLQYGLSSVAHSFLIPNQPQYQEIEAKLIKYEYDPRRRATQLIEELGYRKGSDGMFRDAADQPLTVELRTTTPNDLYPKTLLAAADDWQRLGVTVDRVIVPAQRVRDVAYRATFPGFELIGGVTDLRGIGQLHSSKARMPENNFIGSNYSRYVNAEFDALIDRYYVTIPRTERLQVLGQIIGHIAENLNTMGLFYNPAPIFIANRLTGVAPTRAPSTNATWNVNEWAVK